MDITLRDFLEEKAKEIRKLTIKSIGSIGSGHIGGCLSIIEVLAVLYFDVMNIDVKHPHKEDRDRIVVSKGHAGPAVYSALALRGFFPIEELYTLNKPLTNLPSHCDMNKTIGIDMTAGSLGQGLSCAVGMAKVSKIRKSQEYIYSIIGDGESQEGQIWEASMAAAQYKLDNLIVFLDYNKFQIDGSIDEVMSLISPLDKWKSFGFNVLEIDGHDVLAIRDAINTMKTYKDKPSMIILNTVKGKGVSYVEAAGAANHSMKINEEQVKIALKELE
ncbi:MAG: transketolase [Clostridia bacterium]|nr:transketolase [Clostridia bacterium]